MKVLSLGVIGHFLVNMAATTAFLVVSHHNYPGGIALAKLHEEVSNEAGMSAQKTNTCCLQNGEVSDVCNVFLY